MRSRLTSRAMSYAERPSSVFAETAGVQGVSVVMDVVSTARSSPEPSCRSGVRLLICDELFFGSATRTSGMNLNSFNAQISHDA